MELGLLRLLSLVSVLLFESNSFSLGLVPWLSSLVMFAFVSYIPVCDVIVLLPWLESSMVLSLVASVDTSMSWTVPEVTDPPLESNSWSLSLTSWPSSLFVFVSPLSFSVCVAITLFSWFESLMFLSLVDVSMSFTNPDFSVVAADPLISEWEFLIVLSLLSSFSCSSLWASVVVW